MFDWPRHTVDLAKALRMGDCAAAEQALDLMARDGECPSGEMIARGRAAAERTLGRVKPMPRLAEPDVYPKAA